MKAMWDGKIGDVWLHALMTEKIITARYPEWFRSELEFYKREGKCICEKEGQLEGMLLSQHILALHDLKSMNFKRTIKKKL